MRRALECPCDAIAHSVSQLAITLQNGALVAQHGDDLQVVAAAPPLGDGRIFSSEDRQARVPRIVEPEAVGRARDRVSVSIQVYPRRVFDSGTLPRRLSARRCPSPHGR